MNWVKKSLFIAALILVFYLNLHANNLNQRLIRDTLLFIFIPCAIASYYNKNIGWKVDKRAIKHSIYLSLLVLPFYVIGSTLPTIRAFYPIWEVSLSLNSFIPHATKLFVLALATETYYRGLLCVGVREIGFKSVFISPILYASLHYTKPILEFLLSGPADVVFGALDYRARSILPSVIAHGFGLILLDWLILIDFSLPFIN